MKFLCFCLLVVSNSVTAQNYYLMSAGDYLESFDNISNTAGWPNGFNGSESEEWQGFPAQVSGTIPDGVKITTSTTSFVSGSTGGVQRGAGSIVLLVSGATDNSSSAALELLLNFTGRDAGTLSFDWASVNNSTGNRNSSLKIYTSTDGNSYTELTGAAVTNFTNNSLSGGTVSNISLPVNFNNAAQARIRFYIHNGSGGTSGSRPKINLDNIYVSSIPSSGCSPAAVYTLAATGGNAEVVLSWVNGSCYDEVMAVARQGAAVVFTPSGNGSAYYADAAFGSGTDLGNSQFVISKTTGTGTTVTGLTNGLPYYFSVFTRKGSAWSAAATGEAIPLLPASGLQVFATDFLYHIDFDNTVTAVNNGQFTGAGLAGSPSAGQLDADAWRITGFSDGNTEFGGTYTTSDYSPGVSSGNVAGAALYAFSISPGNHSLGFQPTAAEFSPGSVTLKIENRTGVPLTSLSLAYKLYCNDNGGRSNTFNLSWSADDNTYTTVPALDYSSLASSDNSTVNWTVNHRGTDITGLNILPDSLLYIRWSSDDAGGSGLRDEFALDDISVVANNTGTTLATLTGGYESVSAGSHTAVSSNVNVTRDFQVIPGAVFSLSAGFSLTVDGTLINNGIFTIEDGASVVPGITYAQNGTGVYRVKRNKPAGQPAAYYNLWSSPVDTGNTGMLTGGYDIYKFTPGEDETENYFSYGGALLPGEGIVAKGIMTATFTGTLNNGDILFPVTNIPAATSSCNLIGNPYPSAINAQSFIDDNGPAVLTNAVVYLWSQVNPTNYSSVQDFIAVGVIGSPDYQRDFDLANTNIASGQGFFVEASANADVLFQNDQRNGENNTFKSDSNDFPRFWISISDSGKYASALIGMHPDATFSTDYWYDGKSMGSGNFDISSLVKQEPYCIQGIPYFNEEIVLPLQVKTDLPGNFIIDVPRSENLGGDIEIFLTDKQEDITVNLSKEPYVFSETFVNQVYNDRFCLGFAGRVNTSASECLKDNQRAYFSDGSLFIDGMAEKITIYDNKGAVVVSGRCAETAFRNIFPVTAKGLLLVHISYANGNETLRIFNP